MLKNPRQVKARLDSRGVDTIEVSTNSKNRHGEFTRITTMTYIDEANLLPPHLPELLRFKNPRDVKKRLDSRGVDTIDTPTTCKNRHGEFTMMNPMTFIDEANLYRCILLNR